MLRIQAEALTYDDVSLVPAHSTILPKDVNLETRLTRDLKLKLPILSAAMDTVTEARLAIAMAQLGGMGIIHKNLSLEQQAAEVAKVKKFEAGVIRDPITVGPETTIRDVLALTQAHNISGVPVVGSDGLLAGIVTHRDMRFETELDDPVRHIMTKKDRLVTVKEGAASDEVLLGFGLASALPLLALVIIPLLGGRDIREAFVAFAWGQGSPLWATYGILGAGLVALGFAIKGWIT